MSDEIPNAPGEKFTGSGAPTRFSDIDIEQSISQRFQSQVRNHGSRIALKSRDEEFTYSSLNNLVNRLAEELQQQSGDKPQPIALLFPHSCRAIAAMLGVLKAGNFYLVLDPGFPLERVQVMLEDSGARLIVTDDANVRLANSLAPGNARVVNLSRLIRPASAGFSGGTVTPDSLSMLLYTSGSTGNPKGVIHNHRNVLVEARNLGDAWCISSEDRFLLCTPLSFANSVRTIYGALMHGASIYPYDIKNLGFNGLSVWMIDNKLTLMRWLSTTFRHFAASLNNEVSFPDVRVLNVSGEPAGSREVGYFNKYFHSHCVLHHGLGPTECFTVSWIFLRHGSTFSSKLPVGFEIKGKPIVLVDADGNEVEDGVIGEIVVKSRYISLGYWNKPDKTKEVFKTDPRDPGLRTYRTGDLGARSSNGCITLAGRKDYQVKVRGFRVETAEVEAAIVDITGVEDAVVVGHEGRDGEMRLIGYVVPNQTPGLTISGIRQMLGSKLPDYMVPGHFVKIDKLPLTAAGKTDRKRLPIPTPERPDLETTYAAPETPTERIVAEIWWKILGIELVGMNDPFLELGGDSISAMRFISEIADAVGVELSIEDLLSNSTARQMATILDQKMSGQSA